ncbi:MAG: hypothetical protein P8Y69_11980 [Gammaproteobacteria bacterium]
MVLEQLVCQDHLAVRRDQVSKHLDRTRRYVIFVAASPDDAAFQIQDAVIQPDL